MTALDQAANAARRLAGSGPAPLAQLTQRALLARSRSAMLQGAVQYLADAGAALAAVYWLERARQAGPLPDSLADSVLDVMGRGSSIGKWVGLLRGASKQVDAQAAAGLSRRLDDTLEVALERAIHEALPALGKAGDALLVSLRQAKKGGVLGRLGFFASFRNKVYGHGTQLPEAACAALGPLTLGLVAETLLQPALWQGCWLGLVREDVFTGQPTWEAWMGPGGAELPADAPTPAEVVPEVLHLISADEVVSLGGWVVREDDLTGSTRYGFFQHLGKGKRRALKQPEALKSAIYLDFTGSTFESGVQVEALREWLVLERTDDETSEVTLGPLPDFVLESFPEDDEPLTVLRVRQRSVDREVALAVLSARAAQEPERWAAFERQVLAMSRCDHPNVVGVLSSGLYEERPWCAMEWLEGALLSEQDIEGEVYELAAGAAEGLEELHRTGFVHGGLSADRLLATTDGRWVVVDLSDVVPLGTARPPEPEHPLPERRLGLPLDGRSDVWGLGRALREVVSAPSIELGWILDRATHEDPAQRYSRAQELAEDLRAAARGRRVQAQPPTIWVSAMALSRRHRSAVATGLVALGALLGTAALGLVILRQERDVALAAERQAHEVSERLRATLALSTAERVAEDDPAAAAAWLLSTPGRPQGWGTLAAELLGESLPAWRRQGAWGEVHGAAWSPDGQQLATAHADGGVRLWEPDGTNVATLKGSGPARALAWRLDGSGGAVFADDGLWTWTSTQAAPQLWERAAGARRWLAWSPDGASLAVLDDVHGELAWRRGLAEPRTHPGVVWAAWQPDGSLVALESAGRVVALGGAAPEVIGEGWPRAVDGATSADGRWAFVRDATGELVLGSTDGELPRWTGRTWALEVAPRWDPQGMHVAGVTPSGTVEVVSRTGEVRELVDPDARPVAIAWSADGRRVLVSQASGRVHVWDARAAVFERELAGHPRSVRALATSRAAWATGSVDGSLQTWRLRELGLPVWSEPIGEAPPGLSAAVAIGGGGVVAVGRSGAAWTLDEGGQVLDRTEAVDEVASTKGRLVRMVGDTLLDSNGGPTQRVLFLGEPALSSDGSEVVYLDDEMSLHVVGPGGDTVIPGGDQLVRVGFAAQGRALVGAGFDEALLYLPEEAGWRSVSLGPAVEVSGRDATQAAVARADGRVELVDAAGTVTDSTGPGETPHQLVFSSEGRLAIARARGPVEVWTPGEEVVPLLPAMVGRVAEVRFSADGQLLAVRDDTGELVVWRVDGERLRAMRSSGEVSWDPEDSVLWVPWGRRLERVAFAEDLGAALRARTAVCVGEQERTRVLGVPTDDLKGENCKEVDTL